jgi:hypothetical protein
MSAEELVAKQKLGPLCERLLHQQPQAGKLLKQLLAGTREPFAVIREGRCSSCNMTIATARIQEAKSGRFLNCAHCSVFLYHLASI